MLNGICNALQLSLLFDTDLININQRWRNFVSWWKHTSTPRGSSTIGDGKAFGLNTKLHHNMRTQIFIVLLCALERCVAKECRASFMRSSQDSQVTLRLTNCSGLRLEAIPPTVDANTAVLQFDDNLVTYVHDSMLSRFRYLEQLDMSNNEINALNPHAFNATTMLSDLTLGNNKLEMLSGGVFDRSVSLQRLNLSFNLLRTISNDTFSSLANLINLDLSGNKLVAIEAGAFRNLRKLQELSLVQNQLQTLPGAMESLLPPELRTLKLGYNQWRCDCHLLWLKKFLLGSGLRMPVSYDKDAVTCLYGTEAVCTKALQYVAFTQMVCAPELYSPRNGTVVRKLAAPGTTVRFECSIYVNPKREVMWLKDGETVNTRTYFEATRFAVGMSYGYNLTAMLNISRVDYSDAGNYACVHSNDAGSVIGNFSLEVTRSAVIELAPDDAVERARQPAEDDGVAAIVSSWFNSGSTFFTVVISSAGVCVFIFIVTTVVYCIRTSRRKNDKRRKPRKTDRKPAQSHSQSQSNAKYDQIGVNDVHIDALSAQSAAKFNDDIGSDNLLMNATDRQFNARTLTRVGHDRNMQMQMTMTMCNSAVNGDVICADANSGSPILPPPSYNMVCDGFSEQPQFELQSTTPTMRRFATQQRVQLPEAHFCPVHGSKPAAVVQPIATHAGVMTLNSHHVHQPSCPMFSMALNQNTTFGTIRRQPCPLHGCSAEGAHLHQDELSTLPVAPTQYVAAPGDAMHNGSYKVAANANVLINGDPGNTYMKVSQVDDCIRENMDENNLRAYNTSAMMHQDNGPKRLGPAAGIEEEGESEALSTVV